MQPPNTRPLTVAYPVYWNSLVPALQHTSYADSIMSNQFEPLTNINEHGTVEPLGAKSWSFNSDFTVFTFKIDTTRQFADGVHLNSKHYKDAWEHGLALDPKSSNSSLRDVLYRVIGFKAFERTKSLSGITTPDDETLEIRFQKPFRRALDALSGGRFSAYRHSDGIYLGTGPYVINENSDKTLDLKKNPYWRGPVGFDAIHIKVVPPEQSRQALLSGEIDMYTFAESAGILEDSSTKPALGFVRTFESMHNVIELNGLNGRLFSNSGHRLAFQYLVAGLLPKIEIPPELHLPFFSLDHQTFLPLQPGRLEDSRVKELIDKGESYVETFLAATRERPLYFASNREYLWLKEPLEKLGVHFSDQSRMVDFSTIVQMHYKTHEPDLILVGFSVANGDPDGLHHLLGSDGAIYSPMIGRAEVAFGLENGREILDIAQLDPHYRKVHEDIFKTVPYVHLGFRHGMVVYRKDVGSFGKTKNREEGRLHLFKPK